MSANASTAPKKGGGTDTKYDIDNVIPVLLAALGNPAINYGAMAAMDEVGRTEYAWQHRFRRWKSMANDITAAHPDMAGGLATNSKKRVTPAKGEGENTSKKPRVQKKGIAQKAKKAAGGRDASHASEDDINKPKFKVEEETDDDEEDEDEYTDMVFDKAA
ncbi:MAG: hypothetical protein Q9163_002056 [Psora crenata]